jgi:hydrogenase expression/formation protein HypE
MKNKINISEGLVCPIPKSEYEKVVMAHGGGGTLSNQLIQKMFLSQFDNKMLQQEHDGAILKIGSQRFAFSTDSYVVNPIFFPGGDIGDLAVNGTVNDLSMCGAEPLYISAGFIIEEGFEMEDLWQVVLSMKKSADKARVQIVTGDTKVVDHGKGDKIYINTAGIGLIPENINISTENCSVGDKIIISGRIAEHGVAIMSAREGLEIESQVKSDTAALNELVNNMFKITNKIHVLRDPTRGGISSALNEIAQKSSLGMLIHQSKIPITDQVNAICELLGLDPLYIANEGKLIALLPDNKAQLVLEEMHKHPLGKDAAIIGEVVNKNPGTVLMETLIGSKRVVDMLSGEQLPRIC